MFPFCSHFFFFLSFQVCCFFLSCSDFLVLCISYRFQLSASPSPSSCLSGIRKFIIFRDTYKQNTWHGMKWNEKNNNTIKLSVFLFPLFRPTHFFSINPMLVYRFYQIFCFCLKLGRMYLKCLVYEISILDILNCHACEWKTKNIEFPNLCIVLINGTK